MTRSTFDLITHEFRIAKEVAQQAGKQDFKKWLSVLKKKHFFVNYQWFIRIDVLSTREEDEHLKWIGIVESKLRKLTVSLEETEFV